MTISRYTSREVTVEMKKNFIGVGTALTISCILLSPFTAYASANIDEASISEICTDPYNMDGNLGEF